MDFNYGGYNYGHVDHNEIFDHRQTPMPFEMNVQEIYEPPQHDPYGYRYHNHGFNNQVQPFYFGDGHDRRDRRDRRDRGNYAPASIPYEMDQDPRPSSRISVSICLSYPPDNIRSLRSDLNRNYDLSIDSLQGNILTVTGYPPNRVVDAPDDFLRIVSSRTGDRGAYVLQVVR